MCEFFVSSMCEFATADKFAETKNEETPRGLDGRQKFATAGGRRREIKAYNAARTPSASAVWGIIKAKTNKTTNKNKTKQKNILIFILYCYMYKDQQNMYNNTSKQKQNIKT